MAKYFKGSVEVFGYFPIVRYDVRLRERKRHPSGTQAAQVGRKCDVSGTALKPENVTRGRNNDNSCGGGDMTPFIGLGYLYSSCKFLRCCSNDDLVIGGSKRSKSFIFYQIPPLGDTPIPGRWHQIFSG